MAEPETSTGPAPPPAEKKKRRRRPLPEKEREARAALILGAKLANTPIEDIARQFGISRATAYRELDKAKKRGLLQQASDWLTLNLVPLALLALEMNLRMGNLDAAIHVLDSVGVTGNKGLLGQLTDPQGDEFDELRVAIIAKKHTKQGLPGDSPAGPGGRCDGPAGDRALPVITVEAGTPPPGPGDR